jgi:hypothetical protein
MDQGKDRPTPEVPTEAEHEELLASLRSLIKDPKARQKFTLTPEEVAEALAHGF